MISENPKGRIGSDFDDFLRDEGIFGEVQAVALEKVAAQRLAEGG